MDQSYLGIGYSYGSFNHQSLPDERQSIHTGAEPATTAGNNTSRNHAELDVEDLMRTYMQQCVDYHEHEQEKNQEQSEPPNQDGSLMMDKPASPPTLQVMNFIPAVTSTKEIPDADLSGAKGIAEVNEDISQSPEFVAALERAKAVAQRLANGTSALTQTSHNSSGIDIAGYPYAQKRWEFLQAHKQKLHLRWIGNLQYLAEKDEEQLFQMRNQIAGVNATYNQHQRKRPRGAGGDSTKNVLQSLAGVGSKERHHTQKQVDRRTSSLPVCGIYITGLSRMLDIHPEDDSTTENTLRELFSSYGKVSSVKLYTHRKTGRKKGDGLVLYDWASIRKKRISESAPGADNVEEFQKMICSQVRTKQSLMIVFA